MANKWDRNRWGGHDIDDEGIDWPVMMDEVKIVLGWVGVAACVAGLVGIGLLAIGGV